MASGKRANYDKVHSVFIANDGNKGKERFVSIIITELNEDLVLKVRDVDDYGFNYTKTIDSDVFQSMRLEQSLDVDYNDFKMQLLELLGQVEKKELFIRMELQHNTYLVDQCQIINEMSNIIANIEREKQSLVARCTTLNMQLNEKERELSLSKFESANYKKCCFKELQTITYCISKRLFEAEKMFTSKINSLSSKINKISKDFELIKQENKLKCESSRRLVQSMQDFRLESERNCQKIEELKCELETLRQSKNKAERTWYTLKLESARKDSEIGQLRTQIEELRKCIQDKMQVIADKEKANSELAKDVLQANQVLVNYNTHYDRLAEENTYLKRELIERDVRLAKLKEDFEKYSSEFRAEEFERLRDSYGVARSQIEELEKKQRELLKLNEVLAKKLSETDVYSAFNK